MNTNESGGRTPTERRAGRRYTWEFFAGMAAFLLTFLFLPQLVRTEQGSTLSIFIALVPILPVLWIAIALLRHLRRMDERQRLLFLQSLSVGFAVAMVIAVSVGLVSTAGVDTRYSEWAIYIGGMSAWGISLAIFNARANR